MPSLHTTLVQDYIRTEDYIPHKYIYIYEYIYIYIYMYIIVLFIIIIKIFIVGFIRYSLLLKCHIFTTEYNDKEIMWNLIEY